VALLDYVRQFPAPGLVPADTVLAARGAWDIDNLTALLEGTHGLAEVKVFAELDAAELAAVDTPERALSDFLETGVPPLWSSQHRGVKTVKLGGTLTGAGGTLVSIVGSEPRLADDQAHLQPLNWIVAALRRDDGDPGVVVFVVPGELSGDVAQVITDADLRVESWD
jgi:hypothetical protein